MVPSSFPLPTGAVVQMAYVVDDIESAMAHWTRALGVGPFFHLPHFPLLDVRYRGEPSDLDIDVALTFNGPMCIELIRQNDGAPSIFREVIDTRGYGFHHWAVATSTFDVDLARYRARGNDVVSSGTVAIGARVAYLGTQDALGSMLEIIEVTPAVDEFFGMVREAAQSWDGSAPVRLLGPA
ncbi:MAG TPA: VOC family protein [Polyangiaceae bacterium]|nr:VOC family protein [Polyangiaceae bacterium]